MEGGGGPLWRVASLLSCLKMNLFLDLFFYFLILFTFKNPYSFG